MPWGRSICDVGDRQQSEQVDETGETEEGPGQLGPRRRVWGQSSLGITGTHWRR